MFDSLFSENDNCHIRHFWSLVGWKRDTTRNTTFRVISRKISAKGKENPQLASDSSGSLWALNSTHYSKEMTWRRENTVSQTKRSLKYPLGLTVECHKILVSLSCQTFPSGFLYCLKKKIIANFDDPMNTPPIFKILFIILDRKPVLFPPPRTQFSSTQLDLGQC